MSGANEVVDQPMPTHNDSRPLWDMVIEETLQTADEYDGWARHRGEIFRKVAKDMKDRHEVGVARYGTPLQANNGRDALVDAYQEILDSIVYLKQVLVENKLDKAMSSLIRREYFLAMRAAETIKDCLLSREAKP